MKLRSVFPLLAVLGGSLLLAACDARPQSQLKGQSLLDAFVKDNSPKITGVSDSLRNSAEAAEKHREYGKALGFYQQLADTNPQNFQYRLSVADNLRRLGKLDDALEAYDKVLTQNPHNLDALEGKGLAYIAQGKFEQASPMLEQVMTKDAQRWRALNGVGLLFVAKGLPTEALSYFDAALSQKGESFAILNNLGLTLALTGDYPRAIATLQRASRDNTRPLKQREQADMNLALVHGLAGQMDEAERVISRHLPEESVHNNLGFYAYLANDNDLAKAYLNSALSNSKTFYKRAWDNLESMDKLARN